MAWTMQEKNVFPRVSTQRAFDESLETCHSSLKLKSEEHSKTETRLRTVKLPASHPQP